MQTVLNILKIYEMPIISNWLLMELLHIHQYQVLADKGACYIHLYEHIHHVITSMRHIIFQLFELIC